MKYLLDTNVLIAMFKNQHGIREVIIKAGTQQCAVSELTYGELLLGAIKGQNKKHMDEVKFVLATFNMLPVTREVIELYAHKRAELELQGNRIDSMDLLIACTALKNNLTVVTHNSKHFERVTSLNTIDWEQP